ARKRRFLGIPIEDRRPARLAALQRVMQEVADDHGMLTARADIDAAMAGRMTRSRGKPKRIVERKIVIDEERLPGCGHPLAIETPDIAAATRSGLSALGRFLPGGVFALVKNIFGFGKRRHPAAVAQHRIPAGMIDMQVRAKHIIDVFEAQTFGGETVEPGLS